MSDAKHERRQSYRAIAKKTERMGLRHARARDLGTAEWHVCHDGVILCDYPYDYGIYNTEFDATEPPSGEEWCSNCVKKAIELAEGIGTSPETSKEQS